MNQFTADALEHIADLMDLELVAVHTQLRSNDFDSIGAEGLAQAARNLLRNAAKWAMNRVYSATKEPGHTMLGMFKKKRGNP